MTWAPITVDATHFYLQVYWWVVVAVLAGLFLLMTFVQGGQTLFHVAQNETEERAMLNSLGRKWELTFTTLVLFGGALYAAFPLFYSISFGGAYWVWMLILFAFVLQAVSYEYMNKKGNLIGKQAYKIFLYFNGVVGIVLIGAAVGTFFTGSNFHYDPTTKVLVWGWDKSVPNLRGLEAAISFSHGAWFNLAMGVLLFAAARILGALWLINDLDEHDFADVIARLRKVIKRCFGVLLVALVVVLIGLVTLKGYGYDIHDPKGTIKLVDGKYLHNLFSVGALPLILFLLGLVLFVVGVFQSGFGTSKRGIWTGGAGIVLIGIVVFLIAGLPGTAYYPSYADPQSSLTIQNSSGSKETLAVMAWVSIAVPFVLAYIAWVWYQMKKGGPITSREITEDSHAY
jgi:cytochrome d ubiquinol oxidase subunit II